MGSRTAILCAFSFGDAAREIRTESTSRLDALANFGDMNSF